MWQTITIWIIIALCAGFIGRRFYRQYRSATSSKTPGCVDTSCNCCQAATTCSPTIKEIHREESGTEARS